MPEQSKQELILALEKEADLIHSSTRADISLLSPMHNYLRAKSPTYYKWSIRHKSASIHLAIVLGFIVSIIIIIAFEFSNYILNSIKA
ncbi:hypothetical protein HGB13_01255 [bacterium]|nr:hypothetical protein [bacterium]